MQFSVRFVSVTTTVCYCLLKDVLCPNDGPSLGQGGHSNSYLAVFTIYGHSASTVLKGHEMQEDLVWDREGINEVNPKVGYSSSLCKAQAG